MTRALGLGVAAAVLWGITAITSAPASRLAGPFRAMLWLSVAGSAVAGAAAVTTGPPEGSAEDWRLVGIAGVAYTGSTLCWLLAMRGGKVSLVTPIIACDGAMAAVLAVVAGEPLSAPTAIALAAMVAALMLVVRNEGAPAAVSEARSAIIVERATTTTVALAVTTALLFAIVFYSSGKVEGIDPLWVVAVARLLPLLAALAICLSQKSLLPPSTGWRWIISCGVTDAAGFACYIVAARAVLAVAAVAASQYGAVAVLGGVVLFGERLRLRQWIGVAILIVAAGVIAATGG
jgi:drug/metabolite transporter (DMT)-like permease